MKILVAYYSKGGNTRRVAEEISKELCCDIDEIRDRKNRTGIWGNFIALRDAFRKFMTDIEFKIDPVDYDLVIVGTPIWSFNVSPAVRTYFTKNIENFSNVAFFSTSGGLGVGRTFRQMGNLSKPPVACLGLHRFGIGGRMNVGKETKKIKEFCRMFR